MNFEEYYKISEYIGKSEKEFAKRVWDDCKKEVLQKIKEYHYTDRNDHGYDDHYIGDVEGFIKEIEKL